MPHCALFALVLLGVPPIVGSLGVMLGKLGLCVESASLLGVAGHHARHMGNLNQSINQLINQCPIMPIVLSLVEGDHGILL